MKKYLSLLMVGMLFVLSGCDDSHNRLDPRYSVDQKKKMEEDLNKSLERNINKLQNQEDL